jgi:hypothetical protein
VPAEARHQVESVGDEALRFVAPYGAAEVTTTYEEPVQPDGERRRDAF